LVVTVGVVADGVVADDADGCNEIDGWIGCEEIDGLTMMVTTSSTA
jgi:hypothetical protein